MASANLGLVRSIYFDGPDLLGCAEGQGPFRPPPAGVIGVMGFFSLSGVRSALAQSRAT